MNSNSKGRTSLAGGRTNKNCKTNASKVIIEEVKTVTSEKTSKESTTLAPKAAVTTVASKVEVKPVVAAKVVKEEVKPVVAAKVVKEEVKPVVAAKSVKEQTKPAVKKEAKPRTSRASKPVTKKVAKPEAKKTATSVTTKLNYREILGSEPIKVILEKAKKSVTDYKINVVLKNYNYHKAINALVTEDSWATKRVVELTYQSSIDDDLELWGTSIKIDPKKVENFEYVVYYDVNGQQYFDNNYEQNYKY